MNIDQKPSILSLNNIHLTFEGQGHDVKILKGVDLSVEQGQSVAIVGPSGSGKSSLMAIMTGMEKTTQGDIHVNDVHFNNLNEDQLALFRRENIGVILQSFHLMPTMTALENVSVPLELAGQRDCKDKATDMLQEVGLSHRLDHYPTQLSGGEQQRVAIARALVTNPSILFADEPTGNLDYQTGQTIIKLLFGLQSKFKTTMVIITHDLNIAQLCDRVIEMRDGLLYPVEKTSAPVLEGLPS